VFGLGCGGGGGVGRGENRVVCEIMWINMVQPDWPHNTEHAL